MGPNPTSTPQGDWGPDYGLPHNSKAGRRWLCGGGAESSSDGPRQPGHLVSYACRYLSVPLRTSFLEEVERFRATFYSEDRTLNLAASQWELTHARLQSPTEDASAGM